MRSRDEVIGQVLEAARERSSKTSIMYKSFVSFDKLEELLEHLMADGLLEQEKGEMTYRTTQKGLDFLSTLDRCNTNDNNILTINSNENADNRSIIQQRTFAGSDPDTINFNKVLVIGLGQLGLPVAKYVKDRGFDVYGYDISTKALERAEKTAGIKKAINFSGFDVYIICVSTHKQEDMFSPQIDGILSIVQDKISKEAKNGALVAIESTIPKGTSKKVFEMLNHRLHVAHAPHRWYALEEKEHGVNQLRVVGGVCDCCLRVAMQFYDGSEKSSFSLSPQSSSSSNELESQSDIEVVPTPVGGVGRVGGAAEEKEDSAVLSLSRNDGNNTAKKTSLGIPMHSVPDIEIAELTKIIENAHRYLQIAFAEDLYLYCQANNINFAELRDSLNTKWNVNILEPREGIGGHCLPKDTKMFLNSSKSIKSKILEAAIQIDEDYKKYRQTKETGLCKYAASASKTIYQKC
jgi:UDP-N-acetyl-D-mannosaminuronate dehydrogenase/predicted transcriptional regulator